MLIRRIQPDDNAAVASVIRQVMGEYGAVGPGYSVEDAEVDAMFEAYSTARAVFYVLQEHAEIVGCGGLAQLVGAGPEICELKKMYFLPKTRGQGLGRLLAETLLVDARRFGYERIYIETLERMTEARRLYEHLGFTRLEKPLGNTGHGACDAQYALDIEPQEIDPSLLV